MPLQDWTFGPHGYFHHFRQCWTGAICDALNAGLLPKGMFALVEQYSGAAVPDVLALEIDDSTERDWSVSRGGVALATEPPKTRFLSREDQEAVYALKANRVVLHQGNETVAVIEIVSPGNKSTQYALKRFVEKSQAFLENWVNVLVVDLFPPTSRDPQGIHAEIWGKFNSAEFLLPKDKPLTLASYVAAESKTAYVEVAAVGDVLPDMPLFLDTKAYIRVPLEQTYQATWNACPEEFKQRVIGATNPA